MDCYRTGASVFGEDVAELRVRWPSFARVANDAGFQSVHAIPMRLRGRIIGALNLVSAGQRTVARSTSLPPKPWPMSPPLPSCNTRQGICSDAERSAQQCLEQPDRHRASERHRGESLGVDMEGCFDSAPLCTGAQHPNCGGLPRCHQRNNAEASHSIPLDPVLARNRGGFGQSVPCGTAQSKCTMCLTPGGRSGANREDHLLIRVPGIAQMNSSRSVFVRSSTRIRDLSDSSQRRSAGTSDAGMAGRMVTSNC